MKALLVFGLIGSVLMVIAGISMIEIESVAGNTITEVFYHDLGLAFIGSGIFCAMLIGMIFCRPNW